MKKIRYVQLEPAAVLLDSDVANMTAGVFGCYWKIILHLYCNGGKVKFDLKELARLCNCRSNFEKIFSKIEKKFQIKNGIIKHKRVTAELRRARKFLQHQRQAGLKGAQKRWHGNSPGNTNAIAKKSKGKESKDNSDMGGGFHSEEFSQKQIVERAMKKLVEEGVY